MVKIKRKKPKSSDTTFNTILLIYVTFCLIIVAYPLIFVLASSFSSADAIISGQVYLWPVGFTTAGYEMIFANQSLGRGFLNPMILEATMPLITMTLTIMAAYPLSRRGFQGRNFYQVLFIIPMYFSGGMIPSYLLMSKLGLVNNLPGFIIGAGINLGGILIFRTYFNSSVPGELLEAGKMDGITDIGHLTRIVLPLSKPVIAVQMMGAVVGVWNAYMSPLIYLRDRDLHPLQLIIRQILAAAQIEADSFIGNAQMMLELQNAAQVMQYALIVVTTFPIMIAVPFMQKHFKEGMLIGTLKG